ncbi:MAG: D-alanine--D-alanine ligase family protein [Longimicrobiales bacterium]
MTLRIGFAFNQKPSSDGEPASSEEPPSEEPPSTMSSHDRYAEWDDTGTIDAVASALRQAGDVILLEADTDFPRKLRDTLPDIVFNIAEGLYGPNREAHVPAICEFFDIPYTASDPLTLSLALDKRRAKEVFLARGVPTPSWCTLEPGAARDPMLSAAGPWIVKPLYEGSSKGIPERAFCTTATAVDRRVAEIAATYGQPALVEEFLPGREFTIGILGNGAAARALPIVEISFDALPAGAVPLYGYEAKWVWDTPERPLEIFDCPAAVDAALDARIAATALGAYHALGCRDWSRVDVRLDGDGTPNVIEINPLPGILPDPGQNSCLPKAARAAGIGYDELILAVLECALERYGLRR